MQQEKGKMSTVRRGVRYGAGSSTYGRIVERVDQFFAGHLGIASQTVHYGHELQTENASPSPASAIPSP